MDKVNDLTFKLNEQSLTEKELSEFEENLGVKLPDDFISHYKTFNGGFPNANWSEGVEFNCPLRHFLSIKYGEDTIEKRNNELQLKGLLPFAMNAIEAYFCIGIEASNMGKIFYYRKRPQVKNYKEFYGMYETEFHCDNFSIFLSNLYRDKFYGKVFKPKLGWIEDFELYTKR